MGVCLYCHALLCSECIELVNMPTRYLIMFCHVHMLAIVFSDPFWLKVTKGLFLSSLSSFMPCLALPCQVPVAYSFLAPKCAT